MSYIASPFIQANPQQQYQTPLGQLQYQNPLGQPQYQYPVGQPQYQYPLGQMQNSLGPEANTIGSSSPN